MLGLARQTPLHYLLVFPMLLLLRLHLVELLFLRIVQDRFDFGVAIVAKTLHLRHLVLRTHRLVLMQAFILEVKYQEDVIEERTSKGAAERRCAFQV